MKHLSLIILFVLVEDLYAQSLLLDYNANYNGNNYQSRLQVNDSVSVWEDLPGEDNITPEILIKDFKTKSVHYTDHVFQKKFTVSDSLHPMKWELLSLTKDILTFPCKSARTFFRGREYTAFYTSMLNSRAGPWKFGGLPGIILEVYSSDTGYFFEATRIQQVDSFQYDREITRDQDQIHWSTYCQRFIKAVDAYARYLKTANDLPGGKVNMKIDRPEIIYPRVQNENGWDSE